uniref:Uncharacterized protein n=1 Tax=Oryza nivara TaxID=4536 RepID=A0A0E0FLA5_ORYNI
MDACIGLLAVGAWCCIPALLLCHSSHPASASALPARARLLACPLGPGGWSRRRLAGADAAAAALRPEAGSLAAAPSSPHPALLRATRTTEVAVRRWGSGMGIDGLVRVEKMIDTGNEMPNDEYFALGTRGFEDEDITKYS